MFSWPSRCLWFLAALVASTTIVSSISAQSPQSSSPAAPYTPPTLQSVLATANDREYREDFSSLSLKGSAFFPLPPVIGQLDDNPKNNFTRERWQVMWRPADPIDLFICKPRKVAKPPVILYLYGSPSTTDRFKNDDWCFQATAGGVAAVGFVSAYTGHRLEMRSPIATFFSDFQESLGATVHDVQMILDYLNTRGDLDMSRVGMFGQGSGGAIAILASAADPRIKALDLLTPWGDWAAFFSQTHYVAPEKRAQFNSTEFQGKIAPLEPLHWLPRVMAKTVRLQDVRKSGPMPDTSQERMEAAAPDVTVINKYGDPAALIPQASGGALFSWLHSQLTDFALQQQKPVDKSERVHFYPAAALANPLPPVALPDAEPKKP